LLAEDGSAKATVVTTMPTTTLLPKLRAALVGQICPPPGSKPDVLRDRVRSCLERISIARVFDLDGVAEVIQELGHSGYSGYIPSPPHPRRRDSRGAKAEEKPDHAAAALEKEAISQQQQGKRWTEVQDSEDEAEESLSCEKPPAEDEAPVSGGSGSRPLADMVLVTHMSTLMSTLFTSRGKEFAHSFMGLLSDQLHCLTRYSAHKAPLIMLLNSTSSPSSAYLHNDEQPPGMLADRDHRSQKPLDLTLRSIFNPPQPPPSVPSIPGQQQPEQNLKSSTSSNRNKPTFGLVFSQMLDLHLLCTRTPRTRADAAALRAAGSSSSPRGTTIAEARVSYVWAVEVLLDEMGVYERSRVDRRCDWTRRTNREQRWAAVDVDREGKVVNAFTS
jgi:hypothetical protein